MTSEVCWDEFSDDDDEDYNTKPSYIDDTILWLVQHFLKAHKSKLADCWIFVDLPDDNDTSVDWTTAIKARGMKVVQHDSPCDAAISSSNHSSGLHKNVVHGGVQLLVCLSQPEKVEFDGELDRSIYNISKKTIIYKTGETSISAIPKYGCMINQKACPYKPNHKAIQGVELTLTPVDMELQLVDQATVTRTAKELAERTLLLSEVSVQRAVKNLQEYGYCILKQVLDKDLCLVWGQAVMDDLELEIALLLAPPHEVDLRNPQSSKRNPQSYRELSMREHLRLDLRDGPNLRRIRAKERACLGDDYDDDTQTCYLGTKKGSLNSCLRIHPSILDIIHHTMNPVSRDLWRGNMGRYNFGGTGPDGTPQPLRIGPMGGILSLLGAADQAIHADTPHLFEHLDCLRAHYINAVCLGREHVTTPDGSTNLGGTAFVHGSHKLSFTSALPDLSARLVLDQLVRPSLELGDVILFDCRVLHFGLANTSTSLDRPLLYVNYTSSWFHDPKNWNDRLPIFSTAEGLVANTNPPPSTA